MAIPFNGVHIEPLYRAVPTDKFKFTMSGNVDWELPNTSSVDVVLEELGIAGHSPTDPSASRLTGSVTLTPVNYRHDFRWSGAAGEQRMFAVQFDLGQGAVMMERHEFGPQTGFKWNASGWYPILGLPR